VKGYFDTLRPMEKRLVIFVGAALFLVLNWAFVWPHASDLTMWQRRRVNARQTLERYQGAIQQMKFYSNLIAKLQGEGLSVDTAEQAFDLRNAVIVEASRSGVSIQNQGHTTERTNQFFVELSEPISVTSGEQQLVNFLYNLGSSASLMRVRDMSLHPDPPHYQLNGQITLVASYQKKASAKPGARTTASTGGTTVSTTQ